LRPAGIAGPAIVQNTYYVERASTSPEEARPVIARR